MRPRPLATPGPLEPHDERDTVFARARLRPESPSYEEYYARHPERRQADDRTRRLANLASPEGQRYRPVEAAAVEALFDGSDLVAGAVEADTGPSGSPEGIGAQSARDHGGRHEPPDGSPEGLRRVVLRLASLLDVADVGVAPLDPGFVYSHRGRPAQAYGQPVSLPHRSAVVLVFPMRPALVGTSPEMSATAETARVYQQAAGAAFSLARALQRLGLAARAHVDSNYLVVCPPLAVQAGLGELGRSGILVHHRYGPGVRLAVVTTPAEIACDRPRCWGIAAFCRTCGKCAEACPAGAIPLGSTTVAGGAEKWPMDAERCYHYWRAQGTDCGVCVRVCPFAKPDTSLHRFVRRRIARSARFNRALLRADDWLYGKEARPRSGPRGT